MDRILVVEDDATIRDGVVAFLRHHAYEVCAAEDALKAREIFEKNLLILWFWMSCFHMKMD